MPDKYLYPKPPFKLEYWLFKIVVLLAIFEKKKKKKTEHNLNNNPKF